MAKDPVWKRVVSGVCGLAVFVAILLLLRQQGVSGDQAQQWETALVFGAALTYGVMWFIKRRRPPRE